MTNEQTLPEDVEDRFDERYNAFELCTTISKDESCAIKRFIASELHLERQKCEREQTEKAIRRLKERLYFIQKDGMAEEYLRELINDYTEELDLLQSLEGEGK